MDRWFNGYDPDGFHLTNVLFNAASAGLLALLLCNVVQPRPMMCAAALWVFATRPAHAEAVVRTPGRPKSAVPLALLANSHAYAHSGVKRKPRDWISFLVAIAAKESALASVRIFGLIDVLLRRKPPLTFLGSLEFTAAPCVVLDQPNIGLLLGGWEPLEPPRTLAIQSVQAARRHATDPFIMEVVSPYMLLVPYLTWPLTVGLFAFVVGYRLFWRARRSPVAFLILWFLSTLLSVLGVLCRVISSTLRADRYLYFSSVAATGLIALGLATVFRSRSRLAWALIRTGLALVMRWQRVHHAARWKNNLLFWAAAEAPAPKDATPPRNIGVAFLSRGKLDPAEVFLQKVSPGNLRSGQ